jgi:uncharacterized protein YbjT (DUF2867 family)
VVPGRGFVHWDPDFLGAIRRMYRGFGVSTPPSAAAPRRPRVVIAGASGFVGRALIPRLAERFDVVALSRAVSSTAADPSRVRWQRCDLFSLRETSDALAGADYAVYLVHSMMPSARLTQGSFADIDLVLADNFARAAERAGVRQIVYLGGLAPADRSLSQHLESRLEVERTLSSRGVSVTAVRAGLVVGAGGSSFQILVRLVRRLPLMLCPRWTRTLTQPIALSDVVELLAHAVGDPTVAGAVLEVGGPDVLSYRAMMERTAALLGRRAHAFPVPFFTPGLSRLWVTLVTGTPRALVAPLIQSLRHSMVAARDDLTPRLGRPAIGFEEAVRRALADEASSPDAKREAQVLDLARERRRLRAARTVRSIQRLPLPPGRDAAWVSREYAGWLPRLLSPWIRVDVDDTGSSRFELRPFGLLLLHLRHEAERSAPDRQLFAIDGGALVARGERADPGRLEFREVLEGRFVLAAIHDYTPALPWALYASTQALVHLWVMRRFRRHLVEASRDPSTRRP